MKYKFNEELNNIYSKLALNEAGKSKPDFLDINKNGNRKEPLKKAAKEAKSNSTAKHCACGCIIGKPKKSCNCKKPCKK